MGEVVLGVLGRREPVAKTLDYLCWAEDQAIQGHGGLGGGVPLAEGPPVDKFCLGGREFDL